MALLVAGGCLAALALAAGRTTLSVRGGFEIPHDDHLGAASIVANVVVEDGKATGSFQFAAEDHVEESHPGGLRGPAAYYPDILVRLKSFESATVTDRKLVLKGTGRFQTDFVRVQAVFVDNAGRRKPDEFTIVVRDPGGHIRYERTAKLGTGDIAIARAQ